MKRNLIIIALITALGACASEGEPSEPTPIVDVFEHAGQTVEVVATPIVADSFDVELRYSADGASHNATFNISDTDLADNQDLAAVMSQIDKSMLLHIQGTLLAREMPQAPEHARWLEIERAMFGYANLSGDAAYESCFFGTGTWEYCEHSGLEHCCVFDHGCSWLCNSLGRLY
jgi:hypothetical protein